MFQQTPQKRVLFPHCLKWAGLGVFLLSVLLSSVFMLFRPAPATAAPLNTINFQARLMNASGSIAPDGYYNVEFKLYDAKTAGTQLWYEDYTATSGPGSSDVRVKVTNGYLSIQLGSVSAFPSTINWDQQLYLTMNIGGSGTTASWDGEMSPRLALTAVPYAFKADSLAHTDGANRSTLNWATQTASNTIQLPNESGTLCIQNSSNCGFALSSGSGNYIQNATSTQTANFNVQAATSGSVAAVLRANASGSGDILDLLNGSGTAVATFGSTGSVLFKPSTNSSAAFQIQPAASSTPVFVVNTSTGTVGINLASPNTSYALDVNGDINSNTAVRVGGVAVCTPSACTPASGSNNYIQNTTTVQTAANFSIRSSATNAVTAVLQGASGQTADIFEVQRWNGTSATNILTIGSAGATLLQPTTDAAAAFNIKTATGNNVLTIDTIHAEVGIGLGSNNTPTLLDKDGTTRVAGLEIKGALRLSGGGSLGYADGFTTPAGNVVNTKINIPLYDPGAYGQVLAFGLPAGANINARAITAFDNRAAGNNQPAIGVLQPSESDLIGFSWDGSNTVGTVKTMGSDIALRSGSTNLLYAKGDGSGVGIGNSSPQYPLDVTGDINTSTEYRIAGVVELTASQLTFTNSATAVITSGNSRGLNITGKANSTWKTNSGTLTIQGADGLALSSGSGTTSSAVTLQSGDASAGASGNVTIDTGASTSGTPTLNLGSVNAKAIQIGNATSNPSVNIQSGTSSINLNTNGSSASVIVKSSTNNTSAFQVQGASSTVLAVDTSNNQVGIGTASPTRTLDIAVNNTQVASPMALLEQAGTGDANLELKNSSSSSSFYISNDASNGNSFTVNSYSAAAGVTAATPAYVQGASATTGSAGGTTTVATSFSSSVTAGDAIIVHATWGSGASMTCSDNRGNSYTTVLSQFDNVNSQSAGVCYALNVNSGSTTVTVTLSGSAQFKGIVIGEYSGIATSNAVDVTSSTTPYGTSTTANSAVTSGTATTTQNGDLIYGAVTDDSTKATITAGTEPNGYLNSVTNPSNVFSQRIYAPDNSQYALATQDGVQTSAGPVASTQTFSASGDHYMAFMIAFKAAVSTGSTVTDTNTNSLFTLSQAGAAKFQNLNNSTTAFQVQNSTGTSLFRVDTSNRRVVIGSGVSSSPTLLVLSSGTADPSEVDGAIYYNSSTKSFRCGTNSSWVNCLSGLRYAQTSIASGDTVSNTTTETNFAESYTMPANDCVVGRVYRVTASGTFSVTSTPTLTIKIKLGGVTIAANGSAQTVAGGSAGNTYTYQINATVTCISSTTVEADGVFSSAGTSSNWLFIPLANTGSAVTLSSNNAVQISAKWGTASASNTITLRQFVVEALGPA